MKKFMAFVLAALMVFSLGITAFADHAAPTTQHDYKAYKIFSGEQNVENDATLTNVKWADGIDSEAFLAALKADATIGSNFADCNTAADVAEAMDGWVDESANARAFAKVAYDHIKGEGIAVVDGQTDLAAGYYLVVDVTAGPLDEGDAFNLALLQLTKKSTFDINQKSSAPELEKKIIENNKPVDANNKSIGDTVNYEITTAVPTKAADYDYYYFIIRDTMSKGLTFKSIDKVTIGGQPAVEGTDYNVQYNLDGYTFQIALTDAKAHVGQAVIVDYSAVLNNDAVVGESGNPNKADLQYSNNPNYKYDGTDDENHPGFPDKTKNVPTGETPEDVVVTYTTKIKVTKVDQDKQPLSGAEFTLTGDTVNTVLVSQDKFTAAADGQYYKLTDGTYTKEAPVTADKMVAAAAGATKGYVAAEADYAGDDAITVGGVAYRPFVSATDNGKDVFVLVEANADMYENTTQMYAKSTELVAKNNNDSVNVVGAVDENGVVTFEGLSAGTYTLTETKVPDGYNGIDPITFSIAWEAPETVATGAEKCTWKVADGDNSGVVYNGAAEQFELQVVNQKGNVLPETGGIGTTIFYAIGGLMVAAAAILLVTKKRMSVEG